MKYSKLRSRKILTSVLILSILVSLAMISKVTITNGKLQAGSTINDKSTNDPFDNELEAFAADTVNVTSLALWDDNIGTINDVYAKGNYMYIAFGTNGLGIVELIDLEPKLVSIWDDYTVNHVYVYDDYAFTSNNTGVNIIDISDKANPTWACNFSHSGVTDFASNGTFVTYIDNTAIYTRNITSFINPNLLDSSTAGAGFTELYMNDDLIAYASSTDNIRIYNMTDPINIINYDAEFVSSIRDFSVSGDFIYTCNNAQVRTYNATDLTAITLASTYDFNNTGTNNIFASGNYLYIEENFPEKGLVVVDYANKTNPQYLTEFRETIDQIDIFIYGFYAFIHNLYSVEILDISSPLTITSEVIETYYGDSTNIFIDETTAFVADTSSLEIFDITDPENITKIGSYYEDFEDIEFVYVTNSYAYILEQNYLEILDVTDLTNPAYVSNLSLPGYSFNDFYVDDEFAYIAVGSDGVLIVDIYYPDAPQLSMVYDEHNDINGLDKFENYLYLAATDYIHIIDMTNPYDPQELGNFTRLGSFYIEVFISGDYLYAANLDGIDIIDITDETEAEDGTISIELVKVGQYNTLTVTYDVFVDGQYVYMLDAIEGLVILDATNIVHPKKIGQYDYDGDYNDVWARNGYIYLAEGLNGTRILITEPQLTVKSPLNPYSLIAGLTFIAIFGLLYRKKRRK